MIVARPLVGFRSWRTAEDGRLFPTQWPVTVEPPLPYSAWLEEVAHASCISYDHDSPAEGCQCGLYAYAKIRPDGGMLICGAVVAGGRVVLHEDGFRAEYARPIALLDNESYPPGFNVGRPRAKRIAAVAKRHDLPILPADELAVYAAWHGDLLCHPAQADYFRQTRACEATAQGGGDDG